MMRRDWLLLGRREAEEARGWMGEKGMWEDPEAEGECGGSDGWMGQEA
mgnify:CR=1 FL=1